jgi:Tfp pilus assembly protein PilF
LVVAGKAICFYAAKVVWPMRLTFIYPRWEVDATHPASWVPLAGVVALGVVLCWRRSLPWCRAAMFGGGFFLVALAPVLGFFDVFYFHYSFVADHFQYLASVGLVALAASAGTVMCERAPHWAKPFGPAVAAVTLIALGALTWKQARIYRDAQTVWQDTIAKNPECWMAHLHIGLYQLERGKTREAMEQDELALRLKPDSAEAHNNLAVVLARMGKPQQAIEHWERALQLKPNFAEAHNNLGAALMRQGRPQEAIGHYEQALRIKPDYAEAHNNLGNALFRLGKPQEAIEHWQQALRINPDYADAHYNLGIALEQAGRVQEAIGHYEQALRIQPVFVQAQSNLARARAAQ